MQLLRVLKDAEPFGGDWYIRSYEGSGGGFERYKVSDRVGNISELRVIVMPKGKDGKEFSEMLGKAEDVCKSNKVFLRIFCSGSLETEGRRVIYYIREEAEKVSEVFEKRRVSSGMAAGLACDITEALRACEEAGICHGGVTLENIYYARGTYKLGGLGEAAALAEAGMPTGTELTDAPEVKRDGRSIKGDIYSLGLLIYSLYNYKRLPFMPSKDAKFRTDEADENAAAEKRRSFTEGNFPGPQTEPEPEMRAFIDKCCAYEPDGRFGAKEAAEDAAKMKESIGRGKSIDYPNFIGEDEREQKADPEPEPEKVTDRAPAREEKPPVETAPDRNNYTIGLQEVYNETMRSIRSNRHVTIDEEQLKNIEKTEQRVAEKYGTDSPQYRKFVEKVRTLQDVKDNVKRLKKGNKKRAVIIKVLIGVAAAAVIAAVVFILNSDTYFINDGQYNQIYKRNLFGKVEQFSDASCTALEKDGRDLYFIAASDGRIYRTPISDSSERVPITIDSASAMKIMDDSIYYINASDGQKLYKVDTEGNDRTAITQEAVVSISEEDGKLRFVTAAEPASPKLYDTDTGEIRYEYVE